MSVKDEDNALFRQAMEGVKPLGKGSKSPEDNLPLVRKKSPVLSSSKLKQYHDRPNADIVEGSTFLNYCHSSLPHRDRRRLKRGLIPIEASLDLHGMILETARQAFSSFLANAQNKQYRCVHIIHGKGAQDSTPVLKNAVHQWLPQSPAVLAFCSARPQHGGTGAVYVLLRGHTDKPL